MKRHHFLEDIAAIGFLAPSHHLVTSYYFSSAPMNHVLLEALKYSGMALRKVNPYLKWPISLRIKISWNSFCFSFYVGHNGMSSKEALWCMLCYDCVIPKIIIFLIRVRRSVNQSKRIIYISVLSQSISPQRGMHVANSRSQRFQNQLSLS